MKKIVYFCVIIIALAFTYEFVPLQHTRGLISYSLTVDFEFKGEKPNRIDYCVVPKLPDIEVISPLDEANYRRWDGMKTIKDFDGIPIIVTVMGGDSLSPLGRTIYRWQEEGLVMIAYWPDGSRTLKTASIPDGRVSKQVTVSFP